MTLTTKSTRIITTDERKKLVADLRLYHESYFESIGCPKARYMAKMRFGYEANARVRCFTSEIDNDEPFFVEWVTRDYTPEDNRRLYKYIYNPDFELSYEKTEKNGMSMYSVPGNQFELVKGGEGDAPLGGPVEQEAAEEQMEIDFDTSLLNPDDTPLTDITLRDIAALLLRAPVSRKPWLNKLIEHNK